MEKRESSLQRTRLNCSRVQWWRVLHHCIQRFALHLLMHGLDAAARPWKPIPWHSLCTVLMLIWGPHEVCSDWLCRKLATFAHYAPQHPLTPLLHFTWPTTSWLSCCHSQSLLRAINSYTNVCRNSLHAEVLAFIHLWQIKWLDFSYFDGWVNTFGNIVYMQLHSLRPVNTV